MSALSTILSQLPQLLDGLKYTVSLTLASVFLGSVLGLMMAFGRSYGKFPISTFVYVYEKVFRGIPLLVIFFLVYFGLAQVGLNLVAFPAAVIGLALRSTAYQAQIFRSSINSIPRGQMTAALSIGMSKLKAIRHIILPQVLRGSVPGWSNEFTIILKDTSIAFSIGVIEIMRQARYIYTESYQLALPTLLFVAFIYFIIVFSVNKGMSHLEKKYRMHGFEVEVER